MNGYSPGRILTDVEEPLDDTIAGGGAIDEEQVLVVEAGVCESLGIIHPLVEPDYGGDAMATEVVEVMVGGMQGVAVLNPAPIVGASKS